MHRTIAMLRLSLSFIIVSSVSLWSQVQSNLSSIAVTLYTHKLTYVKRDVLYKILGFAVYTNILKAK